jgi:2-iminobutanoate/2-iminopropanoate deaminase
MTERQTITTKNAPQAIGPYSQGILAGNFVFTAGQISLDPEKGEIVPGGIEAETRRVFQNLKGVLEAAGSSLDRVVKTTVFLRDMGDFARMNSVYAEFFSGDFPARTTVQVTALPKNAAVEIEAIALVG